MAAASTLSPTGLSTGCRVADFVVTICGIEELPDHAERQVTHVLSILDPEWPEPEAFGAYGEHRRLELRFHDIIDEAPGTGYDAPQPHHVTSLLDFARAAGAPSHLLVHCHAGISRSTAAALLMMAQAAPDRDAVQIMAEIVAMRPKAWPNLRMVEIGDRMLGRDGRLIAAARARHRAVAEAQPEIVKMMRNSGRGRELDFLKAQ